MTIQEQREMELLKTRVDGLEKLMDGVLKWQNQDTVNEQLDSARVSTIMSIAMDLAARAGVGPDEFVKHYELRFRWWHDYYLRRAEDVSPELASQLDIRTLEESDVEKTYPELFDRLGGKDDQS